MSFRTRVAVLTAVAVALVVALLAGLTALFVRAQVQAAVDRSLQVTMAEVQRERGADVDGDAPGPLPTPVAPNRLGSSGYFVQLVAADGRVATATGGGAALPPTPAVTRLARQGGPPVTYDAEVSDGHVRVLAEPYGRNLAVLVAAPIAELERTLRQVELAALLTGITGALLGGLLGRLVAGAAVRPVRRLTDAAEQVARTHDLATRLPVRGRDELSRLTATFNTMLAELAEAEASKRQLISDASHELRTPLTSLRTNVELLAGRGGRLPDDERAAVLEDVVAQARELGERMAGILDLARGQEQPLAVEPVAVDEVVQRALASSRRDWPAVTFTADLEPFAVLGDAGRLERAVVNLLGNAAKFGGDRGPVDVRLAGGVLTVSDCGPGIPEADRELVFERFRRSAGAAGTPGSGLGLAIVRQAVSQVGGSVQAGVSPSGGAELRVDLRGAKRPSGRS